MNSKIKNYVDVLFKDVPNTKKAAELKEEILSTLNDHFEGHIAEGKSENQAYTESLAELGDIDELLKTLEPEKELKTKIDAYKQKKAKNFSIAIAMYIFSIVSVLICTTIPIFSNNEDKSELMSIIGAIIMFSLIAIATGIIVYTKISIPNDVEQYITINRNKKNYSYNGESKTLRLLASIMKLYWMIVLIAYLVISFTTGRWGITWIIWIIAIAIKEAIYIFFNTNDEEIKSFEN